MGGCVDRIMSVPSQDGYATLEGDDTEDTRIMVWYGDEEATEIKEEEEDIVMDVYYISI